MILINLDHPLVAAALEDRKVEDTTYRRLSYEIAFRYADPPQTL
jgi:hypothetical protein